MVPDIELTTRLADDIWKVNSDRAMIGRALLNIYHYMVHLDEAKPAASLEVNTRNMVLDDRFVAAFKRQAGNYVRIRIANPAAIIPEEDADRFLEPFQTADKGLHMASAFGIIKKHEGIMSMSSDDRQGTYIDVYLPAAAS